MNTDTCFPRVKSAKSEDTSFLWEERVAFRKYVGQASGHACGEFARNEFQTVSCRNFFSYSALIASNSSSTALNLP